MLIRPSLPRRQERKKKTGWFRIQREKKRKRSPGRAVSASLRLVIIACESSSLHTHLLSPSIYLSSSRPISFFSLSPIYLPLPLPPNLPVRSPSEQRRGHQSSYSPSCRVMPHQPSSPGALNKKRALPPPQLLLLPRCFRRLCAAAAAAAGIFHDVVPGLPRLCIPACLRLPAWAALRKAACCVSLPGATGSKQLEALCIPLTTCARSLGIEVYTCLRQRKRGDDGAR